MTLEIPITPLSPNILNDIEQLHLMLLAVKHL